MGEQKICVCEGKKKNGVRVRASERKRGKEEGRAQLCLCEDEVIHIFSSKWRRERNVSPHG